MQNNIPADGFLALVDVESDWDPNAISSAGAMGLTQLMTAAAVQTGVIQASEATVATYIEMYRDLGSVQAAQWLASEPIQDFRLDPYRNLEGGGAYLNWLAFDYLVPYLADGENRWPAALAAYNWGPGHVSNLLEANAGRLDRNGLPEETRAYLNRLESQFPGGAAAADGGTPWVAMLIVLALLFAMGAGGKRLLA